MQQAFGMRNSNEIELELSAVFYAFHRFKSLPCSASDTTEMMPTPGLKRQRLPVSQMVLPMVQISFHVGRASNANHKIRVPKSWRKNMVQMPWESTVTILFPGATETGASMFRPTQRSVNCCNIASSSTRPAKQHLYQS